MTRERQLIRALLLLAVLLALCAAIGLTAGYEPLSWTKVQHDEIARAVFWKLRLPRVLLAGIMGATLAAVGAALQALFRNPLAEPLTLGVSGGGALGASVAIALGWGARFAGAPAVFLTAFAGALVSVAVVYRLARTGPGFSSGSLLLAGMVVNLIASSALLMIEYSADPTRALEIIRWMAGTLDVVGFPVLQRMILFLVPGWIALLWLARDLHLIAVDEEAAASLGVNVKRTARWVYLAASLLIGVTVAVGGAIGFVGLVVPHLARLLFGQDTRFAIPCSLLFGASFLILCDAVARSAFGAVELPVGAITALAGGPFFLWLMRRPTAR